MYRLIHVIVVIMKLDKSKFLISCRKSVKYICWIKYCMCFSYESSVLMNARIKSIRHTLIHHIIYIFVYTLVTYKNNIWRGSLVQITLRPFSIIINFLIGKLFNRHYSITLDSKTVLLSKKMHNNSYYNCMRELVLFADKYGMPIKNYICFALMRLNNTSCIHLTPWRGKILKLTLGIRCVCR